MMWFISRDVDDEDDADEGAKGGVSTARMMKSITKFKRNWDKFDV